MLNNVIRLTLQLMQPWHAFLHTCSVGHYCDPYLPSARYRPAFHPLQEKHTLNLGFNAEGIHGGALVAVRGADFIVFYDWDGRVVRRVDVAAKVGR